MSARLQQKNMVLLIGFSRAIFDYTCCCDLPFISVVYQVVREGGEHEDLISSPISLQTLAPTVAPIFVRFRSRSRSRHRPRQWHRVSHVCVPVLTPDSGPDNGADLRTFPFPFPVSLPIVNRTKTSIRVLVDIFPRYCMNFAFLRGVAQVSYLCKSGSHRSHSSVG